MKAIERKILILRRSLTRKGVGLFTVALAEQYKQALAVIHSSNFEQIENNIIESVKPDPVALAFENYYPTAADFAMIWRKELIKQGKKADDDLIYYSQFKRTLLTRCKEAMVYSRVEGITKTTEDFIVSSVRNAMSVGMRDGLSVEKIKQMIIDDVVAQGEEIISSRAQMIAQTEMVTASNMAASEAAKSLGVETRKFWSTSGLPNVRDSHIAAEQESIDKNGLAEDEEFESCPGMKYPGDPAGDAEDVINCRCSILYEVV